VFCLNSSVSPQFLFQNILIIEDTLVERVLYLKKSPIPSAKITVANIQHKEKSFFSEKKFLPYNEIFAIVQHSI